MSVGEDNRVRTWCASLVAKMEPPNVVPWDPVGVETELFLNKWLELTWSDAIGNVVAH